MKQFFIFILFAFGVGACNHKKEFHVTENPEQHRKICNSVYYWKTSFELTDKEREFLKINHIGRLYLRYFDVAVIDDYRAEPVATLLFKGDIPSDMEIVPTVFIDKDIFRKKYKKGKSSYAEFIVNRILTMSETNDVPKVHEIQMDCDWTKSTEADYFSFLDETRELLAKHDIMLSTTIRLHQLSMPVPPVDRGVLMCYNTGAVRNSDTRNSILQFDDVTPYANRLKWYKLSLDIAYPTFSWAVWFSNGTFKALLRNADPRHEKLEHKEKNKYRVKEGFYQEGHYLSYGDEVRFEFSSFDEIMSCKRLLEHQLKDYSVILYHLDFKNLSKYADHEIFEIYKH